MELSSLVNGLAIKQMERDGFSMLMEISMLETSSMIKQVAKDFIYM